MGGVSRANRVPRDVRWRSDRLGGGGGDEAAGAGTCISDDDLAWRLVTTLRPFLDGSEVLWLHVHIGSGDPLRAIETLLRIAIERSLPMEPELARVIGEWSGRYGGVSDVAYTAHLLATAVALGLQGPKRKRLGT